MASSGKIVEVIFENAIKTHEEQMQMLPLVDIFKPNSANMQNSGNYVWQTVQQNRPIIEGWDLEGLETDIIEETYPAFLGVPKNDFFEQRADDLRDEQFWKRAGEESGKRQVSELNKATANVVTQQGSLYYESATGSGYEFVAEAQALLKERQASAEDCSFILNDRSNLKFGSELAGRQTLQGRPEKTWATGQIGQNIAEFDVYTGSFLSNVAAKSGGDTTVTADVSEKPEGGTVGAANVVTNVDYRVGTIPVASSANYQVGDVVGFAGVESLGLQDKTQTGQQMTFRVVSIPDGTTLEVFPKPIAQDDPALSVLEKSYANINTQIASGADVVKLNDNGGKSNIFFAKNSIEVLGGDAPLSLLNQFGGMKVISSTMSNGQTMYMAYDGNIDKLTFKCRLFTWWGVTNVNPSANGVAISI
tara:strand:+ start:8284 stop:9540 length:1257 start_codon:yes stop_codon:yes gene_type:complete